jgi:hypothetical protein
MNKRVVLTGVVMIGLSAAFFFWSLAMLAPKSNDPAGLMRTVGQVCGAVGGIAIVLVLVGLVRRG